MKIEVPMAEMPLKVLQCIGMANCKSLTYSIDQESIARPIGELTLEARLATDHGDFVFFARAFKKLVRHDLPQLDIIREESTTEDIDKTLTYVDLGNQRMTAASFLWRKEQFAGAEAIYKHGDAVVFVSGLLLSFPDRDIVIDASDVEPDILITSNTLESGVYMRNVHRSEYIKI